MLTDTVLLFYFYDWMRIDVLIWLVSIPVVLIAVAMAIVQYRQYVHLRVELKQLSKMKHHSIEYDLVLKAMKLCVWRYDIQSTIVTFENDYRDANDSPLAYELPVSSVFDRFLPEYVNELREGVRALMRGDIDDFHMQYQSKYLQSDKTYWGESYAMVDKRDVDGTPLTIVGTSMRIDERKAIERDLIDARNHAEESDKLKSAFLANMSHEVRTPLNAIVGFSDVLPSVEDEGERTLLVSLLKQNTAQLLHLIDDMMSMSELDAGSGTVKKERFELFRLIDEVVARYKERCSEKGLRLVVETTGEDPLPYTDRKRLREILNQYVNNAVKFTDKGSVTVGWEKTDNLLKIWVSDTGKGIPMDHCNETIFERFVKVDEFVPGTGLGLAICRSMAESLGGMVGLQSELGEGSTFWVDLPVE